MKQLIRKILLDILDLLLVLVIGIAIITFCFVIANRLEHSKCQTISQEIGMDYRYSFVSGCRVELEEGKYVPLDRIIYKK